MAYMCRRFKCPFIFVNVLTWILIASLNYNNKKSPAASLNKMITVKRNLKILNKRIHYIYFKRINLQK